MPVTLLERLDERWERMGGPAASKIDRILKERREAAAEIRRLREASEYQEAGKLHVRATDSWPEVDVEVTNGERLQPSMSPITFFVRK